MKRIVFYSKKSVCIGLAAVALQASAADNERATCSDLSLGTSEKFAEANGLLADSSRVYDIDEVVVVSQPKENFRLRQQALSSTSFGSYQMQRLGSRDLRELSCYVPNFVMPNYGSRFTNAMYVRGIGSRINSPAVGIYLDGIPVLSKAAFNLHHYQTSRIDILRGPQGTLYGQNSEGGLVRIYSRNAYDSKGTYVNLGLGSHFYRNVEAAHYMKLSPRIALGVAAFMMDRRDSSIVQEPAIMPTIMMRQAVSLILSSVLIEDGAWICWPITNLFISMHFLMVSWI